VTAPRWTVALLTWLAPDGQRDDVVGDLEEAHRARVARHGRAVALLITALDAIDMGIAVARERWRRRYLRHRRGAPVDRPLLAGASIDMKLGLRMLVKYPGVSIIGTLGMALAIALGVFGFRVVDLMFGWSLSLPDGDRIVTIASVDPSTGRRDRRIIQEVHLWRHELRSIRDVGAYRTMQRDVRIPGGTRMRMPVAEMSAAGFRVAGTASELGRTLIDDDERPGAPPVVVIGHGLWLEQFSSDSGVIGQTIRVDATHHTIVGVMPEGFAFPYAHRIWVPFVLDAVRAAAWDGPVPRVFGRLAPSASVTTESATRELRVIATHSPLAAARTEPALQPRVFHYADPRADGADPGLLRPALFLGAIALFLLPCVNVAVLVYARTVARHGEITLRTALGASQGRILRQLAAESLVLAAIAATLGLWLAHRLLKTTYAVLIAVGEEAGPFWMHFGVTPRSAAYAVAFAVAASLITGVAPAVKATGPRLQHRLSRLGRTTPDMRLGAVWTGLIVAQVALSVALLPTGIVHAWKAAAIATTQPTFPANRFLSARLVLDDSVADASRSSVRTPDIGERFRRAHAQLMARLRNEADVSDVTFTSGVFFGGGRALIEVDVLRSDPSRGRFRWAGQSGVDSRYFDVLGVPAITGRTFDGVDPLAAAATVVVDRTFARRAFGDATPVGRRLRRAGSDGAPRGPWLEIVGVVNDLQERPLDARTLGTLYHPVPVGAMSSMSIAIRTTGAPASLAPRLRQMVASIDPALRLEDVDQLDRFHGQFRAALRSLAWGIAILTICVVVLTAAGLYAMMSFVVARRRREIGIRGALGASSRRIYRELFSRNLGLIAAGVVVGAIVAIPMAWLSAELAGMVRMAIPFVAGFMVSIGLCATYGPARRELRLQAAEALRGG
jgi:putative ABC transport system permease protein